MRRQYNWKDDGRYRGARANQAVVAHHFVCDKLPQLASLGVESFRAASFGPGVAVIHADQLTVLLTPSRGAALLLVGVCHLVCPLPRGPQTMCCIQSKEVL